MPVRPLIMRFVTADDALKKIVVGIWYIYSCREAKVKAIAIAEFDCRSSCFRLGSVV